MMADRKKGRKRSKSDSQSEVSIGSQESTSMSTDFGSLDVSSQRQFLVPRRRRCIPTGTLTSQKLKYADDSYLPSFCYKDVRVDNRKPISTKVFPLCGNYIVDLAAMVSTLKKVATCIKCKLGAMELYEVPCRFTCATKLLLICDKCENSEIFMTIDTKHSDQMNSLHFSSVLGSRLAGLSFDKTSTLFASLNLPPPPSRSRNVWIEKEVIIAADKEAVASMERATKELESTIGIDSNTKCVHISASMDCA